MAARVFILTHNPRYSEAINEKAGNVERSRRGLPIREDWSVGFRTDISPGDVGFLLRQGNRRGIVAKGTFVMPSAETREYVRRQRIKSELNFTGVVWSSWHWLDRDLPKKERRLARYADIEWTSVVDTADRLPIEELKARFRSTHWDRMYASGVEVRGAAGQRLLRVWDEHLGLLVGGRYVDEPSDDIVTGEYEGRPIRASVTRYERVPANRKKCLDHHGFKCAACGFDFEEKYGGLGEGYIHVHHKDPLASKKRSRPVDPIKDLVPLCANCHAMVHRHGQVLSVGQLQRRMNRSR